MLLLFSVAAICANAQHGYGGGYHHQQQHCGSGYYSPQIVFSPPRLACNSYNRRPFINVVIAPRPRVVEYQQPVISNVQPQTVREWVEPHWEEGKYGRVWVEGHYVQREVY